MGQTQARPISKHAQRQIRRDEELQIHLTVQRMENFIMLAYMVGNKKHSIALILNSAPARSRFSEFVTQDRCSYDLYVLCEIIKMQDVPYMNLFKRAKEIYDEHLKPMNDKRKYVPVAFLTREKVSSALSSTNINDLRAALSQAIDDIIGGLASSVWIRFVQSKTYANWRCQERAHACALTFDDLSAFSRVESSSEAELMLSSCDTVRRVHSVADVVETEARREVELNSMSVSRSRSKNINSKRVIPQSSSTGTKKLSSVLATGNIIEFKAWHYLFPRPDSNVYYRPSVLKYDPACTVVKKPLESLAVKRRLFPTADGLEDRNRFRSDFGFSALSSVSSPELLNLINSGSQWLVMFLAGIEGVPLCVSMHSADYHQGTHIAFPYIFANKYHESVFSIDRNDLVGERLDVLFDRSDTEQIVAGENDVNSVKLRTTGSSSMPDIYMGLVRGMPSIFCRMVNPLLESGGNLLSVMGHDAPPNESFDNATMSAGPGVDLLNATVAGDDTRESASLRSNHSRYSGLVVGVKPIFAGDKNTIIGVITIQQKINAKEKWMQGYKYIEDMLALIPEECDIREYEGSYNFASYAMQENGQSGQGADKYQQ